VQHRRHNFPTELGFVASDRSGAVPLENVEEHVAVGRQLARDEIGA
jgi:hypothetical protein